MQGLVLKTFSDIIHCGVLHPFWFSTWVTRHLVRLWSQKSETQSEFCASTALAEIEPGDLGEPAHTARM